MSARSVGALKSPTEDGKKVRWWTRCSDVIQNKWVRVVIFCAAAFFTSCIYFGWQQYQMILFHSGAYSWRCDNVTSYKPDGNCEAQVNAVKVLYSTASGCEFASAAVGGVLLDHLGPRKTAMVGEFMWALGTLLLALSSQSAQMYIPAMIILGGSVNSVCFPCLTTLESFPQWKGLMVALMLSAQTAGTGVAPVLYQIMQKYDLSLRALWLGYLGIIWAPITLLYLCALPSERNLTALLEQQRAEMLAQQKKDEDFEVNAVLATNEEVVKSESIIPTQIVEKKANWSEFLTNVCTLDMMVMSISYMTVMMIYAYYPTVVRSAISDSISDFNGYIMPTQGAMGLIVGLLCDFFPTYTVMIGMCACLEFTMIASLFPKVSWLQYLGAVLFVESQSAVFEIKFTYVAEMFDPYNFGKLVGFLGILGGVGTFINIPVSTSDKYRMMFIIQAILVLVVIGFACFLGWRQARGTTYKSLPDLTDPESANQVPA